MQSEKCKREDLFTKVWFFSFFQLRFFWYFIMMDNGLVIYEFLHGTFLCLTSMEIILLRKKLQWMKRWWSGDWLNLHCILCLENINKLWSKCIQKWILFYICKNTPHTCLLFLRVAFSKKRCIIIEANFSKLGMY